MEWKPLRSLLRKACSKKIIWSTPENLESGSLERVIGKLSETWPSHWRWRREYDRKITLKHSLDIRLGDFYKKSYQDNSVAGVVYWTAWNQVLVERILFYRSSLSRGKGPNWHFRPTWRCDERVRHDPHFLTWNQKAETCGNRSSNIWFQYDLHIHVAGGSSSKKDACPSAWITMLTAMASVLRKEKIKAKVANDWWNFTDWKVMPVGGSKKKILAAKRAGIKEIHSL